VPWDQGDWGGAGAVGTLVLGDHSRGGGVSDKEGVKVEGGQRSQGSRVMVGGESGGRGCQGGGEAKGTGGFRAGTSRGWGGQGECGL